MLVAYLSSQNLHRFVHTNLVISSFLFLIIYIEIDISYDSFSTTKMFFAFHWRMMVSLLLVLTPPLLCNVCAMWECVCVNENIYGKLSSRRFSASTLDPRSHRPKHAPTHTHTPPVLDTYFFFGFGLIVFLF